MNSKILNSKIFVICGAKRSGKDSISNVLVDSYNYTNMKISYELKQVCKNLFGFSEDQMENDAKDEIDSLWGIRPREAMQFIGTEVMQFKLQELLPDIGRGFWIRKTIEKIKVSTQTVVISDMRFMHEYTMLKNTFGSQLVVLRVERPSITSIDAHISEHEWKNIPYDSVIQNNSDLNDLGKKIRDIIDKYSLN